MSVAHPRLHPALVLGALALALVAAVVADLHLGRGFGPDRLTAALADPDSTEGRILRLTRGPRVATGLVCGAALGVAGALLQSVLRNPLASPELTGVNAMAVLGVVAAVWTRAVPLDSPAGMLLAAGLGGLLGGLATVVGGHRVTPERRLLGGVIASAAASSLTVLLVSLRSDAFGNVARWLVGSLDGRTWGHLSLAAPWTLALVALAVGAAPFLPLLAAGPEHALAVGVPARACTVGAVLLATGLVAGATALAGAVAFVGLAVPHLTGRYRVLRPRTWLLASALLGATLLVGCDAVAQALTGALADSGTSRRAGIPAGAVAAVAGAVALVTVAYRKDPR